MLIFCTKVKLSLVFCFANEKYFNESETISKSIAHDFSAIYRGDLRCFCLRNRRVLTFRTEKLH